MTQSSRGRGCIFAAAGFAAAILLALVLGVVVLRTMFYRSQQLGMNMEPAILKGDTVVVRRSVGTIRRGDVVAVVMPSRKLPLMRVIALPGEVVALREGLAVVNGVALDEPYAVLREGAEPQITVVRDFQPVQVPADAFFALGDNRDHAADSRYIGFVKRDDIRGRVVFAISRTKGVRRL